MFACSLLLFFYIGNSCLMLEMESIWWNMYWLNPRSLPILWQHFCWHSFKLDLFGLDKFAILWKVWTWQNQKMLLWDLLDSVLSCNRLSFWQPLMKSLKDKNASWVLYLLRKIEENHSIFYPYGRNSHLDCFILFLFWLSICMCLFITTSSHL